jgi:hypothetical protein
MYQLRQEEGPPPCKAIYKNTGFPFFGGWGLINTIIKKFWLKSREKY